VVVVVVMMMMWRRQLFRVLPLSVLQLFRVLFLSVLLVVLYVRLRPAWRRRGRMQSQPARGKVEQVQAQKLRLECEHTLEQRKPALDEVACQRVHLGQRLGLGVR
jgi:hypothetical protein